MLVQPAFGASEGCFTPVGLAIVASILREAGHSVAIIDARLEALTPEQAARRILEAEPRVVGFSSMTVMFPWVSGTASLIKEASAATRIIIGGSHFTALPEESLREAPAIDAGVHGEGERVIVPLVRAMLDGGSGLEEIPGVAYQKDGELRVNDRPPLIEDLSALPMPAYDILPMGKYVTRRGRRQALMLTSRGCPGRCKFCYRLMFGRRVRRREVEHVLDEMELLEKRYGVQEISFEDDNFTTSKRWIRSFCEGVRRRNLRTKWSCWTRVDGVNEELLSTMKQSGCTLIRLGVESGSQEILDRSEKGTTVEQTVAAFRLAREAGIRTWGFFMIGNIGETAETVAATIRLAKRLSPDIFQFAMAMPYPGTELRQWAEERGYVAATGWEDYCETGKRAVMRTEALSVEEIEALHRKANRALMLSPRWLGGAFLREIREPKHLLSDGVRLVHALWTGKT